MAQIRGVILDIDGTLIDSNDAHAQSWVEAFNRNDQPAGFAEVRPLIGMGADKLVPAVTGLDAERGLGKKVAEERKKLFRERFLPRLQPFPQVRELLERVRRDGLKLVVASSASEEELKPLLEKAGVADLLEAKTSSDAAGSSKPDPDIVQAALKQARLSAPEAVMLGDTPYDVKAAAKAGVRCIALRCGGWSDQDLKGATEIYDDAADLLAHYEQSLLGRRA